MTDTHKKHTKQHVHYIEINLNNFQNSYISECSQLLHPESVVSRCSAKMLFHRITKSYCNYKLKSCNFTTIGLYHGCFLWISAIAPVNSCFCTFSNKITIFLQNISFLQFYPRHFVPYLSFRRVYSFIIENWKSLHFFGSISSSYKCNGAIFYRHRNPFNFISNIFFIALLVDRIT